MTCPHTVQLMATRYIVCARCGQITGTVGPPKPQELPPWRPTLYMGSPIKRPEIVK